MHRPGAAAHVGLFLRGRVLHIKQSGVEYQPLDVAIMGFKTHRFYDVTEKDNTGRGPAFS